MARKYYVIALFACVMCVATSTMKDDVKNVNHLARIKKHLAQTKADAEAKKSCDSSEYEDQKIDEAIRLEACLSGGQRQLCECIPRYICFYYGFFPKEDLCNYDEVVNDILALRDTLGDNFDACVGEDNSMCRIDPGKLDEYSSKHGIGKVSKSVPVADMQVDCDDFTAYSVEISMATDLYVDCVGEAKLVGEFCGCQASLLCTYEKYVECDGVTGISAKNLQVSLIEQSPHYSEKQLHVGFDRYNSQDVIEFKKCPPVDCASKSILTNVPVNSDNGGEAPPKDSVDNLKDPVGKLWEKDKGPENVAWNLLVNHADPSPLILTQGDEAKSEDGEATPSVAGTAAPTGTTP